MRTYAVGVIFVGLYLIQCIETTKDIAVDEPETTREAERSNSDHLNPSICRTFQADNASWWRFEWCHERYVRQYSVDNVTGEERDSILLGTYQEKVFAPSVELNMTWQLFMHGDMCQVGQSSSQVSRNRSTEVRFACCSYRPNETYIESVVEPRLCDYILSVCTPSACHGGENPPTSPRELEKKELAETVKRMFYHAYDSYMTYAFPLDNLRPISCDGEQFELGKIPMLTLIDTLDTLVVFGDFEEFRRAVDLVIKHANFNIDTEVSVFETTIRVLGGLLSAHLFAIDPKLGIYSKATYNNGLLDLAIDLGDRLLPAFLTKTGIPYGTVNLRRGVPKGETPIASTAGAGSLSMEFTMLSVLSKNPIYAKAARTASRGLFFRRSVLGLLGKHIDTSTGEWTETTSGPGSNSDSFYEYLLKMYVLFGDEEALNMFYPVYSAVMEHNKHGDWYGDVSMWDGCGTTPVFLFDNLVAFWPGMQTLLGDMGTAATSLNAYFQVWQQFTFLPEQFDVGRWRPKKAQLNSYPLRPELLESTFYMHLATEDPSWLAAGALAVHSLERYSKTKCGYASIADVEARTQQDNMPSFFLSETCKYLYLLFDQDNFIRRGNYVFTTEAHPFPVLASSEVEPILRASDEKTYLIPSVTNGWPMCSVPPYWQDTSFRYRYDDAFERRRPRCVAPPAKKPAKSPAASSSSTSSSLFGGEKFGYFVVEQLVGGFRVRRKNANQSIKVTNLGDPSIVIETHDGVQNEFRIFEFESRIMQRCRLLLLDSTITCSAALFGLTRDNSFSVSIKAAPLAYSTPDILACDDEKVESAPNRVLVTHRGQCYFDEKAKRAANVGAAAAIIVNTDTSEELMIMGRSGKSESKEDGIDIPVVMVSMSADERLRAAASKGQHISLEVGAAPPTDWPRVDGTRYDMTIWGPHEWGLRLVSKVGTENNGAPYWTISIAKMGGEAAEVDDKEEKKGIFDQLAEKLKFLGFSDEKLALFNSDDAGTRLDALVEGLRDIGLNEFADKLLDSEGANLQPPETSPPLSPAPSQGANVDEPSPEPAQELGDAHPQDKNQVESPDTSPTASEEPKKNPVGALLDGNAALNDLLSGEFIEDMLEEFGEELSEVLNEEYSEEEREKMLQELGEAIGEKLSREQNEEHQEEKKEVANEEEYVEWIQDVLD